MLLLYVPIEASVFEFSVLHHQIIDISTCQWFG